MVDPNDDLTDARMPDTGTDGHVTLLLAEYLAGQGDRIVPLDELQARVRQLATEHRSYWRKHATDPGAEVELTAQALHRLEALRLPHRRPAGFTARPALARYALADPTIQTRGDR